MSSADVIQISDQQIVESAKEILLSLTNSCSTRSCLSVYGPMGKKGKKAVKADADEGDDENDGDASPEPEAPLASKEDAVIDKYKQAIARVDSMQKFDGQFSEADYVQELAIVLGVSELDARAIRALYSDAVKKTVEMMSDEEKAAFKFDCPFCKKVNDSECGYLSAPIAWRVEHSITKPNGAGKGARASKPTTNGKNTVITKGAKKSPYDDIDVNLLYDDIDVNLLYCFRAKELWHVLKLREKLLEDKLISGCISLQEMIFVWVPTGVAELFTFDIPHSADVTNPLPFSFISHIHTATVDKLGEEVIECLNSMGDKIIWMDLCSMCQDTGIEAFQGYNYNLHTRPVVENLHVIVSAAQEGSILLNLRTSSNPDPLDIHSLFRLMADLLKQEFESKRTFFFSSSTSESDLCFDPAVANEVWESAFSVHAKDWGIWHGTTLDLNNRFSLEKVLFELTEMEKGWFPTHEYFGRLWCYVERLGMNPDRIYINNVKMKPHLDDLNEIIKLYRRIGGGRMIFEYFANYQHRVQQLFGTRANSNETLGPYAQVELLNCFCDEDRPIVASIEAKLRGETINLKDWVAGLHICLGIPLSCFVGTFRKIRARDFIDSSDSTPILSDASVVFKWMLQSSYLSTGVLKCIPVEHKYFEGGEVCTYRTYRHIWVNSQNRSRFKDAIDEDYSIRTRGILHTYSYCRSRNVWCVSTTNCERRAPLSQQSGSEPYPGYSCLCHFREFGSEILHDVIPHAKGKFLYTEELNVPKAEENRNKMLDIHYSIQW